MMRRLFFPLVLLVAGCSSILPDKPVREIMYDFGPGLAADAAPALPTGAPLVLPEVEVSGSLDGPAMLYRLGYDDPNRLWPYAYARWSAPPGQLLRQRLRESLGRTRPVLDSAAAASLARRGTAAPVMRVELEEFSQQFDSPTQSKGVIRVRCTLLENTPGGERVVAQRSFVAQQPAPTPDASGGVRALTAATDAVAADIAAWLRQP